jgi:hypothetical protein
LLTVSEQKPRRLNLLQRLLPEGLLATTSWLEGHGYTRSLLAKYVQRGWLESPARGVYRRPGPPLVWQHAVVSLQTFLGVRVHVGGLTALELEGHGHFLRLGGIQPIHLYSAARLGSWVSKLSTKDPLVLHRDRLFAEDSEAAGEPEEPHPAFRDRHHPRLGLRQQPWSAYGWPIVYSTPERAILELLDEVPANESPSHANLLIQGLTTLSPRRLARLLRSCRSVKVKRLFFALAGRHNHRWLEKLDPKEFDLGKGKRMLIPGGRLHPRYLITLPEDLNDAY